MTIKELIVVFEKTCKFMFKVLTRINSLRVPSLLFILDIFIVDCISDFFNMSLFLDIVNQDLKSTLRVLYNLFTKYKNLS